MEDSASGVGEPPAVGASPASTGASVLSRSTTAVPATRPLVPGRPARGYLPQLDGLRAVAIVLVVVHHALTPLPFGGLVGVDVFFVLSGYLITGLLLAEYERTRRIGLARFYVRRAIRLYPPLLATVAALFVPGLLLARHEAYFLMDVGAALTYLTPVVLLVNDGVSVIFRHTWSLGIEELFYLVWPLVLIQLLRVRRGRAAAVTGAIIIGLAILGVGVLQSLRGAEMAYVTRSGSLFLGCALALALHHRQTRPQPSAAWVGAVLLALGVVAGSSGLPEGFAVLLASGGSLGLTAYLARARSGLLVSALALPPVAYIGRISYEIYLWHYPLFMLASRLTGETFLALAWFCVPVSVLLAALTHALLAPLTDRWKAWATRKFSAPRPEAPVPR